MRDHSQPPYAEGSGHTTETEEQTTRGGVQGDSISIRGLKEGQMGELGGRHW